MSRAKRKRDEKDEPDLPILIPCLRGQKLDLNTCVPWFRAMQSNKVWCQFQSVFHEFEHLAECEELRDTLQKRMLSAVKQPSKEYIKWVNMITKVEMADHKLDDQLEVFTVVLGHHLITATSWKHRFDGNPHVRIDGKRIDKTLAEVMLGTFQGCDALSSKDKEKIYEVVFDVRHSVTSNCD